MAWKKQSVNGILIATETVTLPTDSADSETSAIDFIPRGRGFVAVINTGATDLTAAAVTDLVSAVGAAGVYEAIQEGFAADCDAAFKVSKFRPKRDDAALATSPRYKLRLEHAGAQTSELVTFAIFVDLSDSDIFSK
jgi:hypothetical protein